LKHELFSPVKLGPLTLKNRSIRSAAFEGMCPGGIPSDKLIEYHRSLAAGGIGMTTVAYVSVTDQGRTFSHQAWASPGTVAPFRRLTDAVHAEGGAASIQLGHGGNMGDKNISRLRPVAPSAKVNLFGLSLPRKMNENDIKEVIAAHGTAVLQAREAGFDAVEIHAGHGYLISQFLSPYTNRRRDAWGGSLENRARLLRAVLQEVRCAAGSKMAVLVKTNMEDGFSRGMNIDEGLAVARIIEEEGADALVLSGGFVSKTSFFMMKGRTPHRELMELQENLLVKLGMFLFSRMMLEDYPYCENYFLEDAKKFRETLSLPLIYVGGLVSQKGIDAALEAGFDAVALARALVAEPDFINRLKADEGHISPCLECGPCNSCVATMYMGSVRCPYVEETTDR